MLSNLLTDRRCSDFSDSVSQVKQRRISEERLGKPIQENGGRVLFLINCHEDRKRNALTVESSRHSTFRSMKDKGNVKMMFELTMKLE